MEQKEQAKRKRRLGDRSDGRLVRTIRQYFPECDDCRLLRSDLLGNGQRSAE